MYRYDTVLVSSLSSNSSQPPTRLLESIYTYGDSEVTSAPQSISRVCSLQYHTHRHIRIADPFCAEFMHGLRWNRQIWKEIKQEGALEKGRGIQVICYTRNLRIHSYHASILYDSIVVLPGQFTRRFTIHSYFVPNTCHSLPPALPRFARWIGSGSSTGAKCHTHPVHPYRLLCHKNCSRNHWLFFFRPFLKVSKDPSKNPAI